MPLLKKSRWLLLKREENLKTEQRFRLRDILRYSLKTVRAYLLKEAFQQLWGYNSPAWAAKFLDQWCRQVMRSGVEPMKKIARSMRDHRELILNYFRAQSCFPAASSRGLNNKAKVTMREILQVPNLPHASNSRSITHLASCRNRNPPTNFSDESNNKSPTGMK